MKKIILVFLLLILAGAAGWGALFYQKNLSGIGPAVKKPSEDIVKIIEAGEQSKIPLKFPEEYDISILARDLAGARVIAVDRFGNFLVSQTSEGKVTMLEVQDGKVMHQGNLLTGLRKPHGLAIDPDSPQTLYVAEEHQVRRLTLYSEDPGEIILELPAGGGHFTRSIEFGPDKKLYISVGSTCNVCREKDERRAAILRHDPKTRKTEIFARGLRNAVFFKWHPTTKALWATEMGRDLLGDNLPPDEINIVEEGKNYGWPICYGKNIHDSVFDPAPEQVRYGASKNTSCADFVPSYIEIPAHSAPLGLAFAPASWPEKYKHDLFVAYHGSWNRSTPTGYKIVRFKLDRNGNYEGADSTGSPQVEDFITGWLSASSDGALGRPVDILIKNDTMYISDDKAGVIYALRPKL